MIREYHSKAGESLKAYCNCFKIEINVKESNEKERGLQKDRKNEKKERKGEKE